MTEVQLTSLELKTTPCYLFIDPGFSSGAAAVVSDDWYAIQDMNFKEDFCGTITRLGAWVQSLREMRYNVIGAVEKVQAAPPRRQGNRASSSSFNFGQGFGACQAILCAWQVPFRLVAPATWQEIIDSNTRKTPRLRKDSDLLDPDQADKEYRERRKLVKGNSWNFAKRMFPNAELKFKTKHQDRADALCGAYWLSKQ